jgi:hypothetical protein
MNSFQYWKRFVFFGSFLIILSFFVTSAHSLAIQSKSISSTIHRLPVAPSDGKITLAQTEAKPLVSDPSGSADPGVLIFGPVTVQREKGKPETKSFSFTVSDANGPFLFHVANGTPEGTRRVSSGVVKLNGKEIFRPSEFSQKVADLDRQVTLISGENLIEVRLRSAPGASITLEIHRLDQRTCPIFGPKTFVRKKGKPVEETLVFESDPELLGPFTMNLMSGDASGSHRVDSAVIKLNGDVIFDPSSFNEQIGFLSQAVSLQSTNSLSVELRGKPGDLLTIEIMGEDNIAPSVTITNPSDGAVFDASPISVSGVVDDPTSTVTVNGITASVGSDGSFTVDGIALVEGLDPIKAIAADPCGNQGEDQILVYLRTVPQGPQLVLCAVKIEPQLMTMEDEECKQQVFTFGLGTVNGRTDDTAVSVTFNGVLLPDGQEIFEQGPIQWALRQGPEFNVDLWLPEDGIYPFTAVATDANGNRTKATVTFIRDTVPPNLTITSPPEGLVTNSPTITITGTVDDPEAIVIDGYGMEIPVVNGTFTTQATLEEGQWNFIWIGAIDPAGNLADAWFQITLDTIPPQINITHPTEGMAVNSPTLNVTGTIIDQNIDAVTVEVNSGPPQLLALTGNNFGGTVSLSAGSNTLAFHAADKAGNTGSLTSSVLLDLELPTVAITAPQVGGVISGVVTVTAEASDTASGITSVTLYVDAQAHATLNQPPFNFTLDTSTFTSGTHTLTVRAKDKAENESEASVSVAIDNASPVVAITAPLSGVVVSGLITVSVQASDPISGIASVSLYVDGQLQATQTLPPFNLPLNTLPFASGTHTITAKAVDNKGNQAEASILLVFDHTPPVVSITSPASGATVSGTIAVTVEASDSISGVASVTLSVNSQPYSTLSQPPFNFTVDTSGFVAGSYTVTARAIDRVENQAEASITILVSAFRIEIISPVNGAAINKSNTIVYGKIYGQTGETGVVVNGVLAEVQGSDFAAIVPLQVGESILTAVATTSDGFQVQTCVTINTASQQETVRLTVYPSSGILMPPANTLDVTFEAEAYLPNPVASYSWDFNGDGTPEITGASSKVAAQYQNPGLYFPRVTVSDGQGNTYTETTTVNVLSREEMDGLLRSKWEGMKVALGQGNISEALNYFIEDSRDGYGEIFELLASQLPGLVPSMREINMVEIKGNSAEYYIKRFQRGLDVSYFIYFMKNENGIWRISSF